MSYALAHVGRGNTLVLKNGTYYQSLRPNIPTSGTRRVVIRAETDGGVTIDGQGVRQPVELLDYYPNNYLTFRGIVARNGTTAVWFIRGRELIFRRCSGYDADPDGNSLVWLIWPPISSTAVPADILIEDCIGGGLGRKMFQVFSAAPYPYAEGGSVTYRRCFSYWAGYTGRNFGGLGWPTGCGMEFYDTPNGLMENCISYGNIAGYHFGFKAQDPSVVAYNNRLLGCIAVNGGRLPNGELVAGCMNDGSLRASGQTYTWGVNRPQPTQFTDIQSERGVYEMRCGFSMFGSGGNLRDNVIQDCLAYNNAGVGLASNLMPGTTYSNNSLIRFQAWNNGLDIIDSYAGGLAAHPDALSTDLGHFATRTDNKIARVWTGGSVSTAEAGGAEARLRCRYVGGVYTSEPLWPWPMQDRVRAELGLDVTSIVGAIAPGQVY